MKWRKVQLGNDDKTFALPKTNTLEILVDLDLETAKGLQLQLDNGPDDARPITLGYNRAELQVLDAKAPLSLKPGENKLNLRIFMDRSVLEVFADETVCITKIISPFNLEPELKISAEGGKASAKQVEAWPMKTIW